MNKLIFSKINFDFKEINKYFLTIINFYYFIIYFNISIKLESGINFEGSFQTYQFLTLMNTVNSSAYGIK